MVQRRGSGHDSRHARRRDRGGRRSLRLSRRARLLEVPGITSAFRRAPPNSIVTPLRVQARCAAAAQRFHRNQFLEIPGLARPDLYRQPLPCRAAGFPRRDFKPSAWRNTPQRFRSSAAILLSINSLPAGYWKRLFASAPASLKYAFKVPEEITVRMLPMHPRYGRARRAKTIRRFWTRCCFGTRSSICWSLTEIRSPCWYSSSALFPKQSLSRRGRLSYADLDPFLSHFPRFFAMVLRSAIRNF